MKKKSKKSLQELILQFLSRKKAVKREKLLEEIEIIIDQSHYDYTGKTKPRYAISRVVKRMLEDEALKSHQTNFSTFLSITRKGKQKLRNIKLSLNEQPISLNWDGYWRMVVIDIPELRKKENDAFRYILKKSQFIQIKNTLWISPFPMEYLLEEIKKDFGFENEVMIFLSKSIDEATQRALEEKIKIMKN